MSWSDHAGALNAATLAAFGETVTYQPNPPLGTAVNILAIREDPSLPSDMTPGRYLGLAIRLSDVADPARGDSVTIAAASYTVIDVRREETGGMAHLALSQNPE